MSYPHPPVKGVVFDVDGTLVDSPGVVLDCYRRAIVDLHGPDRSPTNVAYVGDGPAAAATARSCGALAIAAGWGHQHHPARDVDFVAHRPADLVTLLLDRGVSPHVLPL